MNAYKLEMISYLKYRVTHKGVDIGTIEMSPTAEIGFTYYNGRIKGHVSEVKYAVRALLADSKEG